MLCTFLFFNFNLFPLPLAHQNEKKVLSKAAILALTTKKKNSLIAFIELFSMIFL